MKEINEEKHELNLQRAIKPFSPSLSMPTCSCAFNNWASSNVHKQILKITWHFINTKKSNVSGLLLYSLNNTWENSLAFSSSRMRTPRASIMALAVPTLHTELWLCKPQLIDARSGRGALEQRQHVVLIEVELIWITYPLISLFGKGQRLGPIMDFCNEP